MIEPVRCVVFDAVGTLIEPHPSAAVAYHAAGSRRGSTLTPAEVRRRFRTAFRTTLRQDAVEPHRTDELAEREFWRSVVSDVFAALPASARHDCFEELYSHFAQPAAWKVYPDVGPALRALSQRRLRLAVASNFDARLHGVVAGHSDLATIERWFVSSEIGWRKPDRRFFTAVCDGLLLKPSQVLYVGDDADSDVAAAAAAGLRSVLIRRAGPAETAVLSDLRRLPERLDPTRNPGPA